MRLAQVLIFVCVSWSTCKNTSNKSETLRNVAVKKILSEKDSNY